MANISAIERLWILTEQARIHDAIALRYNLALTDLHRPKTYKCGVGKSTPSITV